MVYIRKIEERKIIETIMYNANRKPLKRNKENKVMLSITVRHAQNGLTVFENFYLRFGL